jgi:hypothetical protein
VISLLARRSLDTFYRIRVLVHTFNLAVKEGRVRGPGVPELQKHLNEADQAAKEAIETITRKES